MRKRSVGGRKPLRENGGGRWVEGRRRSITVRKKEGGRESCPCTLTLRFPIRPPPVLISFPHVLSHN